MILSGGSVMVGACFTMRVLKSHHSWGSYHNMTGLQHHRVSASRDVAESLAHVGTFEWEIATGTLTWSDELYRLFGYEPDQFTPSFDRFLAAVHPEDRQRVQAEVFRAVQESSSFRHQERIIRTDGSVRVLQSQGRVQCDAQGFPSKLIGACADVTELVDALERTQVSEARYRMFVDNAADAMYLYGNDGRILDINHSACESLGYSRDQLLGEYPFKFSPMMNPDRLANVINQLELTGEAAWEGIHQKSDGTRFPVEIKMKGFVELGEKRCVAIVRDISRRKEEERVTRANEQRMRMALQTAHMVAWEAASISMQFTYVSEHCEKLLGYTQHHWLEPDFWNNHVHPEDRRRATEFHRQWEPTCDQPSDCHISECSDSGPRGASGPRIGRIEYRMVRSDGATVYIEECVERVVSENGGWILRGVLLDVSDRWILNEQLRQSQKMEAVGRIAGGVAHGFNNLLTVILSYSDLLLMSLPDNSPMRSSIESISEAGKRGSALTKQLLAYSRKAVLEPRVLSLNDVLQSMVVLFRPVLGERIDLILQTDPELRPILIDRTHLEQVIMNLVINAHDAMDGCGSLRIETHNQIHSNSQSLSQMDQEFVELAVVDDGCGMKEELITRIFDPFFTTKEVGRGSGLGLSVVQGVVEGSGGSIHVESQPDKGSRFRIFFPAATEPETIEKPLQQTPPVTGIERVLLVEDDADVRSVTAATLQKSGYAVVAVESGDEAMAEFERTPEGFDALLTDIMMPGMNGRVLGEKMRAIRPDLPILFMSGHNDDASLRNNVHEGNDDFIEKPFQTVSLSGKLRQVLDRCRRLN